jgi:polygalacturonase
MRPNGATRVYDISLAPYSSSSAVSADNTNAINQAIKAAFCNGGGVVYVPTGTW